MLDLKGDIMVFELFTAPGDDLSPCTMLPSLYCSRCMVPDYFSCCYYPYCTLFFLSLSPRLIVTHISYCFPPSTWNTPTVLHSLQEIVLTQGQNRHIKQYEYSEPTSCSTTYTAQPTCVKYINITITLNKQVEQYCMIFRNNG